MISLTNLIIITVASVLVFICLLVILVTIKKHKMKKERQRQQLVTETVLETKQKKLDALMQYLTVKTHANKQGEARKSTMWVYQANTNTPHCAHGLNYAYNDTRYANAYADVCPQCCANQCFSMNGNIMPEFYNNYIVPNFAVQNVPMQTIPIQYEQQPIYINEAPVQYSATRMRLRLAKNRKEYPTIPPPIAPPGYKAVAMVLERK